MTYLSSFLTYVSGIAPDGTATETAEQYKWLQEEIEESDNDSLSKKLEIHSRRWDQARCRCVWCILPSEKYR